MFSFIRVVVVMVSVKNKRNPETVCVYLISDNFYNSLNKTKQKAGDIPLRLRTLVASSGSWYDSQYCHGILLTTISNIASRVSDVQFWPLRVLYAYSTQICMQIKHVGKTQNNKNLKRLRNFKEVLSIPRIPLTPWASWPVTSSV